MSAQVLTLEELCKEQANWQAMFEPAGALSTASSDSPYRLHEVLRHLVTTLTLPLALDEVLHTLANLTMKAMEMELCVILLKDQAHDCLRMCTCAPDLSDKGVEVQIVHVNSALWNRLHMATVQGQIPRLNALELEALNPLKNVHYETLYPLPLIAGTECIGLINCYSSKILRYSEDNQLMLTTIANQTALAIKHRQSVDEDVLAQKSLVKTFIQDLCDGSSDAQEALRRRANFLGFDLARPHAVALIDCSAVDANATAAIHDSAVTKEERLVLYEGITGQLKLLLQEQFPGSLADEHNNLVVGLLNLAGDHSLEELNAWLADLIPTIRHERHIRMFVGVSNNCYAISDYHRGYLEAQEALEIGRDLNAQGCSNHFNALGAYRYIYSFARSDTLRDEYQDHVDVIVEYDKRKRANLLDTLEIYLECGGNVARTAQHLDVHRNTLLQRLDRLQRLCSLDLEQRQHRLPLLLALKVYRLRSHNG
jgi:sugar diacid utilization regulator